MRTYDIRVNSNLRNERIDGLIDGIVFALTGMPSVCATSWWDGEPDTKVRFRATEEIATAVRDSLDDLNNYYPGIFIGIVEPV